MSFAFAAVALTVVWAFPGCAQEPFQLKVEKRRMNDGTGDSSAGTGLRISRDKLGLNAMTPVAAPNGAALPGRLDGSGFNLHARDFALPGEAKNFSNPLMGRDGAVLGPMPTRSPLQGHVSAKALADYDIELLVDESLSMRQRDCPGGSSRWDWCGAQLNALSTQLSQYCPNGFTLTTFAGDSDTYLHASSDTVHRLFANPNFGRGTRLAEPLQERFQNYFAHRNAKSKPLLVVVITDGVPAPRYEPDMVANTLIDASNYAKSPGEVTVVFFQIGGRDHWGRAFLDSMDKELTANGAKYDIVQNVSFENLQSVGLTNALVGAVRNYASALK